MSDTPIVTVEQGQLQGKVVSSPSGRAYFSFQGVPYAKPPLGSLRFKAPQPHEPWEGIRDATTEGNASAQIDMITKNFIGDENCLFLNVYTPNLDGSFLPVMVYIHGGGFRFGSGSSEMYGPDFLVEKDVVLVTINYRLGPLGFLSLNTPEVPGNAGLKDIVLALRWVKENIQNFGGNPGNLTIFGESAGGGAVSTITASPLTKNLISKAIIQSGTALLSWFTQREPIDNARKLAKALGSDAESVEEILEFLSATPTKDIVEAHSSMTSFDEALEKTPNLFTIVVEKEFPGVEAVINEPFADLLKSGRVAQVPTMIGSTALEFAFEKKSDDLQSFIPEELNIEKDSETSLAIVEELKKLYFKGNEQSLLEFYQLVSDKFINIDNHRYVQHLLQSSNIPVYLYKFDYIGELNVTKTLPNDLIQDQCMHMDELGYLFKNDFQKDVEPTTLDLKVRERMVRLWTNFAKTGNPTPDENHYITVTWPPVAKDNEHYLHISEELSIGTNYDKEKMEFWDGLYQKYYKIWDQPQPHSNETRTNEPVIVETLTIVSNSSEMKYSSETVETREVIETRSEVMETQTEDVQMPDEIIETQVAETPQIEETQNEEAPEDMIETPKEAAAPQVLEAEKEVVDAPVVTALKETNNITPKPYLNGNSHEKSVKRTSNEIKMVQNSNGVPKDVIRANDPPEDDLPKNIGVNKFVNFFESLGGKK